MTDGQAERPARVNAASVAPSGRRVGGQSPQGGHGRSGSGESADHACGMAAAGYTVKLSPQPQLPLALGFWKVKPAAKSSSFQSMTEPIR
jgi:hypothetical protein